MSEEKEAKAITAAKAATAIPIPKSKRGVKGFIQETLAEMKKVHWASKQETTRLTYVVLAICFSSVLLLYGLSMAFEILLKLIITGK